MDESATEPPPHGTDQYNTIQYNIGQASGIPGALLFAIPSTQPTGDYVSLSAWTID